MEKARSVASQEDNLSLSLIGQEGTSEKADPLASNFPQWSSRHKCLMAYACLLINFISLNFSATLLKFGMIVIIPYAFFKFFIGMPYVLLEMFVARYVMGNIVRAWNMTPFAKGIFYGLLLNTLITWQSSNIYLVYIMKYVLYSVEGASAKFDWEFCDGSVNCYQVGKLKVAYENCIKNYSTGYCNNLTWESSAEQFWNTYPGNTKKPPQIAWSFVNLFVAMSLIAIVNYGGIQTTEKVFLLMVYPPIVVAAVFAFTTFLIPGSIHGFISIFKLQWTQLSDVTLWATIFDMSVPSLGVGLVCLGFISSHGDFFSNIFVDVIFVLFANLFSIMLTSLPIVSVIAYVNDVDNAVFNNSVEDIPITTAQYQIFISFSEALTFYPNPRGLWAFLFYFNMAMTTFASEVIMALALCEAFSVLITKPIPLFYISCIFGLFSLLLCTPLLFIKLEITYPFGVAVGTSYFLTILTLIAFYGMGRLNDDFHFMMGYPVPILIRTLSFCVPFILTLFLVIGIYDDIFKDDTKYTVFIAGGLILVIYFLTVVYQIYAAYRKGRVLNAFLPNPDWGPENNLLMKSRIFFNARAVTKEFMYRQELYRKSVIKPADFSNQAIVELS